MMQAWMLRNSSSSQQWQQPQDQQQQQQQQQQHGSMLMMAPQLGLTVEQAAAGVNTDSAVVCCLTTGMLQ
jgi:hypothetical protein